MKNLISMTMSPIKVLKNTSKELIGRKYLTTGQLDLRQWKWVCLVLIEIEITIQIFKVTPAEVKLSMVIKIAVFLEITFIEIREAILAQHLRLFFITNLQDFIRLIIIRYRDLNKLLILYSIKLLKYKF